MMNLSLGVRPVNGAVSPTRAPLEASLASPRRIECCTSSAGKRLRCTFFCCARNCSASSDLLTVWVTIRERYSCTAETYILTNGVVFGPINTTRRRLGGFFAKDSGQMVKRLWDSEGVHFAGAIEARLDRLLQIMSGNLHRQRIADGVSGAFFEGDPRGMRQRDPHRPPAYQELDIHRVGMTRGNSDDHRLELHVHFLPGPAVADSKVVVHGEVKV